MRRTWATLGIVLILLLGLLGGGGAVLCMSLEHLALEIQPSATHEQQVADAECSAQACADVSIGNVAQNAFRVKMLPPIAAHTVVVAMGGAEWAVIRARPTAAQRRAPRLRTLRTVVLLI